jgi:XTP/dITP diphosphohydrolase
MSDFTFVTSNDHKVRTAQTVCRDFGLTLERKNMDLLEIQSDSGEEIARFKVEQAYQAVQAPVAVTDDNWLIPGLNGFPGPYMKYINQWLKPEDFLNLTRSLEDRRIIMRHIIAYKDNFREKLFSVDIEAIILKQIQGSSVIPHFAVISFDGGGESAAEAETTGTSVVANRPNAWHEFCSWFNN